MLAILSGSLTTFCCIWGIYWQRAQFLNLQEKSITHFPTLMPQSSLMPTDVTKHWLMKKHCLSFCLHWSSLFQQSTFHTVIPCAILTAALPCRLDKGHHLHFGAREVQAAEDNGLFKVPWSPTTRKMPQTQTVWLLTQSSFQTTCCWRWQQTLLPAWHSLLFWRLALRFFSPQTQGGSFAKANNVLY